MASQEHIAAQVEHVQKKWKKKSQSTTKTSLLCENVKIYNISSKACYCKCYVLQHLRTTPIKKSFRINLCSIVVSDNGFGTAIPKYDTRFWQINEPEKWQKKHPQRGPQLPTKYVRLFLSRGLPLPKISPKFIHNFFSKAARTHADSRDKWNNLNKYMKK